MVLSLVINLALFSVEILYVYAFAMFKTVGCLRAMNQGKLEDENVNGKRDLFEMILYWILICITSLIESWVSGVVNIHTLRVIFFIAMLNPKINLKRKITETCLVGDKAWFEILLSQIQEKCRVGIDTLKKVQ